MHSGGNNNGSSFFHNIQDFIRGNSGNGVGMMQNMYLGPFQPNIRLSDPETKTSPNLNSLVQNQELEKESARSSNEVKLGTTPFNIEQARHQDYGRSFLYQHLLNEPIPDSNRLSQMVLQD